jgi:hypothetical protein
VRSLGRGPVLRFHRARFIALEKLCTFLAISAGPVLSSLWNPCTSLVVWNTSTGAPGQKYHERYRSGAPKDGSYASTNLLVAFVESIERNKPTRDFGLSLSTREGKLLAIMIHSIEWTSLQVHAQGEEQETQEHMLCIVLIRLGDSHTF